MGGVDTFKGSLNKDEMIEVLATFILKQVKYYGTENEKVGFVCTLENKSYELKIAKNGQVIVSHISKTECEEKVKLWGGPV